METTRSFVFKELRVTHFLESHEIARLEALAKAMTVAVVPSRPYTVRGLLKLYGCAGIADLCKQYVPEKPIGVSSYYSPPCFDSKGIVS